MSEDKSKKTPEQICKEEALKFDPNLSGGSLDTVVKWLVKKKNQIKVKSDAKRKESRLVKIQEERAKLEAEEAKLKSDSED